MSTIFSDRIADVPRSFIREILKVAIDPSVISFAGGLPNRDLFPLEGLRKASEKLFDTAGRDALQYANSEGYLPLREFISRRYREKMGLEIPPDDILITSGSQQGLDLLGKTFLNQGDDVVIEEPGYLGAIQALSVYQAAFSPAPVTEQGVDVERIREIFSRTSPKLFYTVPNFQNPSGITYPQENRREVAGVVKGTGTLLVEDNPYGELRFAGAPQPSFKTFLPDNTILLGSFSKIIAPGLRLGWIAAPPHIMDKLIIAKQASDLHSDNFSQRLIHIFLSDNDLDNHIRTITDAYGRQRQAMIRCIREYLPPRVAHTNPEGGMFLWLTLPEGISSMELFHLAIRDRVAFVPGNPFYVDGREANTLRLNFSCVDEQTIEAGIRRLAVSIGKLLGERS